MIRAKILLGDQEFECEVEVRSGAVTYYGTLPSPIDDKQALDFWRAYEEAVTGTMLREVEALEQQLASESCRVVIGDKEYQGASIDLQVFPSTNAFSFTIFK